MLQMLLASVPPPTLMAGRPAMEPRASQCVMDGGFESGAWRESLRNRMEQVRDGVADVKVVVIETILPGQRVVITAPPKLVNLFTENREGSIVMLGRQGMNVARYGVKVTLEDIVMRPVVPGIHPEGTADITLSAGQLCEVVELLDSGITSVWLGRRGRARWVELDEEDQVPLASHLLSRSEAIEPLVDEWTELMRTTSDGRSLQQLSAMLLDLGPIPDATLPNRRAFWVAALLNPPVSQTGRGGSFPDEMRSAVMAAPSTETRLGVVERALQAAISNLRRLAEEGNAR